MLHGTNRLNEAKIFYEETLRLDANMTDAMANLATLLHSIGKLTEAKVYYIKSLKSSPNNPILLLNYALCLSSLKYHYQAYQIIEKASIIDKNDILISNNKKILLNLLQNEVNRKQNLIGNIQNLFVNKNYDEVINNLLGYYPPVEEPSWWYYLLGITYYYNKQYDLSLYYCNISYSFQNSHDQQNDINQNDNGKNHNLQNSSILINICLGLSYQSIGNYDNSIKYYEESLEILTYFEKFQQKYIEIMPLLTFNITEFDLQNNLLKLYLNNLQYKKCILQFIDYFDLMNLTQPITGVDLLVFSYIKWSGNGIKYLNNYQQTKMKANHPTSTLNDDNNKNHSNNLLSDEVTLSIIFIVYSFNSVSNHDYPFI